MPLVPAFSQQQFRIAAESSYGVIGTNWRRINSQRLMLEPTFETEQFTASGSAVPTISALNDDYTQGELDGKADYETVQYALSSLLGPATITTPGGGTNSRQWAFSWDGRTPYVPQSYSVQVGLAGDAEQALGCLFNGFGLNGGRDGMDSDGELFGLALTTGNTMGGATNEVQTVTITGTPTGGDFPLSFMGGTTADIDYDATATEVQTALEALAQIGPGGVVCAGGPLPGTPVTVTFKAGLGGRDLPLMTTSSAGLTGGTSPAVAVTETTPGADTVTDINAVPMFPLDFTLYMDDSWAALGTTKLTQTFELDWAFGEKFERTKPINAARDSDSYVEMAEQEHELTLTLANDAAAKGLISRIRTGGMKFIRIKAEGPTIESAIKYSFILDLACFITESAAADEMDSIYVREFTLMVGRDATSGKAIEAKVVNKRQSL